MSYLTSRQLDDSGYVSKSITLLESLSLDCSSINENSNFHATDFQNNRTFDLQHVVKRTNNVNKESRVKLKGVTCTSTPYSKSLINDEEFGNKLNQPSCSNSYVTPKSRKRKKCWTEFDSPDSADQIPYINDNHDFETSPSASSINRHEFLKMSCTRKLLNDFSDGSLSDTDLEKKKKIRLEGTRSEPNSPGRSQSLQSPFNNSKLGLAEKNEMLYPKLRYRARPKKYNCSTPQKIRQQIKDELLHANIPSISKPSQNLSSFIRASKCVDFFTLFTEVSSNFHIIKKILLYLDPEDLESVYNVSRKARCCIREVHELNSVLKRYQRNKKLNKENVFVASSSKSYLHDTSALNSSNVSLNNSSDRSLCQQLKCNNSLVMTQTTRRDNSVETSPRKREWLKFVEASATLTPGQKLTRCGRCTYPAKVLNNIVLCTRRFCQFICCSKCCNPLCESVQYLEKFNDIENMPTTPEFLNDIPPCSNNSTEDNWPKRRNTRLFLAECGNSMQNELSLSHSLNSSINNNNNKSENYDTHSNIFNFNILDNSTRSTVTDLYENRRTKSIRNYNVDLVTPESPPKINKQIPISSKSSKKNLRRL